MQLKVQRGGTCRTWDSFGTFYRIAWEIRLSVDRREYAQCPRSVRRAGIHPIHAHIPSVAHSFDLLILVRDHYRPQPNFRHSDEKKDRARQCRNDPRVAVTPRRISTDHHKTQGSFTATGEILSSSWSRLEAPVVLILPAVSAHCCCINSTAVLLTSKVVPSRNHQRQEQPYLSWLPVTYRRPRMYSMTTPRLIASPPHTCLSDENNLVEKDCNNANRTCPISSRGRT